MFEAWAVTLIPNVLPNRKQVGDKGVDGRGFIQLGKDKNGNRIDAKIIVSVKGGDSLNPGMVRDLIGTMDSEKTELGVFICLREPTRKMKEAAAKAGIFETPLGEKYPKLQIYSILDYFNCENFLHCFAKTKKDSNFKLEDFVKAPKSKFTFHSISP